MVETFSNIKTVNDESLVSFPSTHLWNSQGNLNLKTLPFEGAVITQKSWLRIAIKTWWHYDPFEFWSPVHYHSHQGQYILYSHTTLFIWYTIYIPPILSFRTTKPSIWAPHLLIPTLVNPQLHTWVIIESIYITLRLIVIRSVRLHLEAPHQYVGFDRPMMVFLSFL